MDYKRHYDSLITRAKTRILDGYSEQHHIVPKCMGGLDNKPNLVKLTPEEHFVAHQLLVKIYPNNFKLAFAASMMCVKSPKHHRNNKMYGWLRKAFSEAQKNNIRKVRTKETKPRKKRTLSEEHKTKISAAGKGRVLSSETRDRLSTSLSGRSLSEEHKTKISIASNGRKHSENTKKKISEVGKGRTYHQKQLTCPHCSMVGGSTNMTRYHFEKCASYQGFP
jgi:hypothetical protein